MQPVQYEEVRQQQRRCECSRPLGARVHEPIWGVHLIRVRVS